MRISCMNLQRPLSPGQILSSCHLNKHHLIKSLGANPDERDLSCDEALKALPPKISPILPGSREEESLLHRIAASLFLPLKPLLRWSPATGHAAEFLDEEDPYVGYDAEIFP